MRIRTNPTKRKWLDDNAARFLIANDHELVLPSFNPLGDRST